MSASDKVRECAHNAETVLREAAGKNSDGLSKAITGLGFIALALLHWKTGIEDYRR